MSTLNYTELAKLLFKTVEKAGKTIMEYYDSSLMNVQLKRDDSPVTDADLASNEVITKALSKTGIPILSVESDIQDFHIRKNWKRYWLIDPLDGTKEYINKNGEFTVNIALIENNIPTLGVVSIPEKNKIYIGGLSLGHTRIIRGSEVKVLNTSKNTNFEDIIMSEPLRVVASKSYQNSKLEIFLKKFNSIHLKKWVAHSNLCRLLIRKLTYIHVFHHCMEWDTAASDAILRSLGYQIRSISPTFEVGNKLTYNKENLYNSAFIAY